jgi:hypothetical protein
MVLVGPKAKTSLVGISLLLLVLRPMGYAKILKSELSGMSKIPSEFYDNLPEVVDRTKISCISITPRPLGVRKPAENLSLKPI